MGSKLNTMKALEHSPDFIICQGLEAGGHVQGTSYIFDVLSEVIEVAKGVTVLVAGGISTGHDMRNVLKQGAAGVVMGTRFVATKESDVHDHYKIRLVEAGEDSTVYTNCFNRGWNAMHRVLRNRTLNTWEADGCPLEGNLVFRDKQKGQWFKMLEHLSYTSIYVQVSKSIKMVAWQSNRPTTDKTVKLRQQRS